MTPAPAKRIRLGPDLTVPTDVVTQSLAILAIRRAGKSNAGVVLAEGLFDRGLPWVAIDPKGDWWGVRSSADGTGPGLAVPILGGRHADVPLTADAGGLVAEVIVDENLTCVLDVSTLSKTERNRFLTDFAERLYHLHTAHPSPRHLFCEEAHNYLPQRVMRDQARLVGAWSTIITQGGFVGLGATVLSQRSARVNKDALTQLETLIALRTTGTPDRKAVLDWVGDQPTDQTQQIAATLSSLDDGEAWVCSPHWLGKTRRIRFDRRRTFDSGATPTAATTTSTRPPTTLADIDMQLLTQRMADVADRADATNPAKLRRRIADLERQLAERDRQLASRPDPEPLVERVEIPVIDPGVAAAVSKAAVALGKLERHANAIAELTNEARDALRTAARAAPPLPSPAASPQPASTVSPPPAAQRRPRPAAVSPSASPAPKAPAGSTNEAAAPVKAGARRMLEVLARHHPLRLTRSQLATLAGMKVTGGTFSDYLGTLRRNGFIDLDPMDRRIVAITEQGLAAAGIDTPKPLTTEEILDVWRNALKKGARLMLDLAVDRYPDPVTRDELAEASGITATGGTFGDYLSTLRRNGLVDVTGPTVTASDSLFLSVR